MPIRLTSMLAALVLVAAVALSGSAASAQTRPLQTEEATTAPRGTFVLEVGADAIHDEPNFVTGGLARPLGGARAAPRLLAGGQRRDRRRVDGPRGTARRSRFRQRLRLGRRRPAREGALHGRGAGPSGHRRAFRRAPARDELRQRPRSQRAAHGRPGAGRARTSGAITLHGNAGLALHDEVFRPHEQRDFFAYGLAARGPAQPGSRWSGSGRGWPAAASPARTRIARPGPACVWARGAFVRDARGAARAAGRGRHLGVTAGVTLASALSSAVQGDAAPHRYSTSSCDDQRQRLVSRRHRPSSSICRVSAAMRRAPMIPQLPADAVGREARGLRRRRCRTASRIAARVPLARSPRTRR